MTDELTSPAFRIAANALANCSTEPVSAAQIAAILRSGDGPGHLVRALFEDCSFETLNRLALALGLSSADLRAAYRRARAKHQAVNPGFEDEDPPRLPH